MTKITIIGNSLPFGIYNFKPSELEFCYPNLLKDKYETDLHCAKSSTIITTLAIIQDLKIKEKLGDVIVINVGVSDTVPLTSAKYKHRFQEFKNNLLTMQCDEELKNKYNFLYSRLEKSDSIQRIQFVTKDEFVEHLSLLKNQLLLLIPKHKIIIIGIVAFGPKDKRCLSNEILLEHKKSLDIPEFNFIDFSDYDKIKRYIGPDKVHYNLDGHKFVAEKIKQLL